MSMHRMAYKLAMQFGEKYNLDEQMVEDLAQEGMIGAYIAARQYFHEKCNKFSNYSPFKIMSYMQRALKKILRQTCRENAASNWEGLGLTSPTEMIPSRDQDVANMTFGADVEYYLSFLEERERNLMLQFVVEGKSQKQLAIKYRISKTRIQQLLKAAREKLQALFPEVTP